MKRLTHRELTDLRSRAVHLFATLPGDLHPEGAPQDYRMDDQDRRAVAWLEASMLLMGERGMLKEEVAGPLMHPDLPNPMWDEGG